MLDLALINQTTELLITKRIYKTDSTVYGDKQTAIMT